MKKTILFIFTSFVVIHSMAQNSSSLSTVNIDGFGSIALPTNMEIQGGSYKEISDKIKNINGVSASKVIFQQKGLNNRSKESFNTYGRVFIRTESGSTGQYQKNASFTLSSSDLTKVNDQYKNEIYSSAKSNNATIQEWYPAKMSSINGYKCVTFGYVRKVGANQPVSVQLYFIQNYSSVHTLTFEYRIADEDKWKSTFEKCKKSLTIKIQ